LNKDQIIKAIAEVIKEERFFNSAFSEQIQESQIQIEDIEVESFHSKKAPNAQVEESEF